MPNPTQSDASFGITHYFLRFLAKNCMESFFREVTILGSENLEGEGDGPLIIACSHSNMAVDPVILSCTLPGKRPVHYWVKDALFVNPIAGAILRNAGNIPVDRKNKNNQSLFKGSFEAMAKNEIIAIFPEGTSHTSPHMLPFKDGVSWLALEYVKYLNGQGDDKSNLNKEGKKDGRKAKVVPVGLSYMDKRRYRSKIVVTYGKPIDVEEYEAEFMSGQEGAAKSAVKKLTKRLEMDMLKQTVNAHDWDTLIAAQMARELLWERIGRLPSEDYVKVSQTLVDLFTDPAPTESITRTKSALVEYNKLLITSKMTNDLLSDLPLPHALDPSKPIPLPNRFSTLFLLIRDTLSILIRTPFFILPMIIHLPMYYVAKLGENMMADELETQAQMKMVFGMLLSFLVYPFWAGVLWWVMGRGMVAAVVAGGAVYAFNTSHQNLVDDSYDRIKRLVAAWRIIVGLWTPRRERSLEDLAKFVPTTSEPFGATPLEVSESYRSGIKYVATEADKRKALEKLPTRRLIKHVLRARVKASGELEALIAELERGDVDVNARPWLSDEAAGVDPEEDGVASKEDNEKKEGEVTDRVPMGKRSGREVVRYLRGCGAKIWEAKTVDGEDWGAVTEGEE